MHASPARMKTGIAACKTRRTSNRFANRCVTIPVQIQFRICNAVRGAKLLSRRWKKIAALLTTILFQPVRVSLRHRPRDACEAPHRGLPLGDLFYANADFFGAKLVKFVIAVDNRAPGPWDPVLFTLSNFGD